MSAWRILLASLGEHGGKAHLRQIRGDLSTKACMSGMKMARRLGLVTHSPGSSPTGGGNAASYTLTEEGWKVVQGQCRVVRKRTPGDGTISGRLVVEAVQ